MNDADRRSFAGWIARHPRLVLAATLVVVLLVDRLVR